MSDLKCGSAERSRPKTLRHQPRGWTFFGVLIDEMAIWDSTPKSYANWELHQRVRSKEG